MRISDWSSDVCSSDLDHEISLRILREFGDYLRGLLVQNRREGWYWFEDNLSYDNARLPEALLRAGMALGSDGMIADGLATLEWLKEMQTAPAGHFRAVGTASFGRTMRKPMPFDHTPLEAAALCDRSAERRGGQECVSTCKSR